MKHRKPDIKKELGVVTFPDDFIREEKTTLGDVMIVVSILLLIAGVFGFHLWMAT